MSELRGSVSTIVRLLAPCVSLSSILDLLETGFRGITTITSSQTFEISTSVSNHHVQAPDQHPGIVACKFPHTQWCSRRSTRNTDTVQTASAATKYSISAVSWSPPRMDIFGIAPDASVWHKFYTGYDWQPAKGFQSMQGVCTSAPTAISWGSNRLDYFVLGTDSAAYHKFWDGYSWQPTTKYHEALHGNFTSPLAAASWSANRIDVVGRGPDMAYYHKYFDGSDWQPQGTDWESFGGNFSSPPAVVSWGNNRLDVFGITPTGALKQKYWSGDQWVGWEDRTGLSGPFVGTPVASSWGPDRIDLWAVGKNSNLYHKYWDVSYWTDWENMGGTFKTAPQVVHQAPNKIDIVGQFDGDDTQYYYKYWDGTQWQPSVTDWYPKGGDFASPPALVSLGEGNLNFFGLSNDGELKLQVYAGNNWQPSSTEWWSLGDTLKPYSEEDLLKVQDL